MSTIKPAAISAIFDKITNSDQKSSSLFSTGLNERFTEFEGVHARNLTIASSEDATEIAVSFASKAVVFAKMKDGTFPKYNPKSFQINAESDGFLLESDSRGVNNGIILKGELDIQKSDSKVLIEGRKISLEVFGDVEVYSNSDKTEIHIYNPSNKPKRMPDDGDAFLPVVIETETAEVAEVKSDMSETKEVEGVKVEPQVEIEATAKDGEKEPGAESLSSSEKSVVIEIEQESPKKASTSVGEKQPTKGKKKVSKKKETIITNHVNFTDPQKPNNDIRYFKAVKKFEPAKKNYMKALPLNYFPIVDGEISDEQKLEVLSSVNSKRREYVRSGVTTHELIWRMFKNHCIEEGYDIADFLTKMIMELPPFQDKEKLIEEFDRYYEQFEVRED